MVSGYPMTDRVTTAQLSISDVCALPAA